MKNDLLAFDDATGLAQLGVAIREIREIRKESNLSQEELAHRSQIDRSHMGRIERGERNVSIVNLFKIARGLGCRPSLILMRGEM